MNAQKKANSVGEGMNREADVLAQKVLNVMRGVNNVPDEKGLLNSLLDLARAEGASQALDMVSRAKMSKVEELRDKVMANHGVTNPWYGDPVAMAVDSLIAAAREEGAEAERERIRKEADEWMSIPPFSHCNVGNDYPDRLCLVPESVLSPAPKESK